jgi:hypothetical protein
MVYITDDLLYKRGSNNTDITDITNGGGFTIGGGFARGATKEDIQKEKNSVVIENNVTPGNKGLSNNSDEKLKKFINFRFK